MLLSGYNNWMEIELVSTHEIGKEKPVSYGYLWPKEPIGLACFQHTPVLNLSQT